MRITKSQLKQIIKEELETVVLEQEGVKDAGAFEAFGSELYNKVAGRMTADDIEPILPKEVVQDLAVGAYLAVDPAGMGKDDSVFSSAAKKIEQIYKKNMRRQSGKTNKYQGSVPAGHEAEAYESALQGYDKQTLLKKGFFRRLFRMNAKEGLPIVNKIIQKMIGVFVNAQKAAISQRAGLTTTGRKEIGGDFYNRKDAEERNRREKRGTLDRSSPYYRGPSPFDEPD